MEKIIKSKLLSGLKEIKHGTMVKSFTELNAQKDPLTNDSIINTISFLDGKVFISEQKHSDNIKIIDESFTADFVSDNFYRIKNNDALITNQKNLNLVVYTADCLPILIFDNKKNVIAAVHAGWKGIILNNTEKTIEKLIEVYGSKKEDLIVYIGPSIGPCCYGVKNENQIEKFKRYKNAIAEKNNKIFIDLRSSIEEDLLKFGIKIENIEISRICTACNVDILASHYIEKENQKNYNLTFIGLL